MLPIKLPSFNEEYLQEFSKCPVANKASPGNVNPWDVSKIVLWNNRYITIGGKTVYNKGLVEKGIIRIGDPSF